MSERQTCPRRLECGQRETLADIWEEDRWCIDADVIRAKHDAEDVRGLREHNERAALYHHEPPITLEEYRAKWYVRGPNNDLWLWSWGPPRTCNFCGGIHPEDALRLLADGWEAEGTGKNYKRYLQPPGAHTMHEAYLASIKDTSREPGQGVPSIWMPTPPVKVYFQHFTPEQGAKWNEILNAR